MKTNLIKFSAVALAVFTLNGCDSFLDEERFGNYQCPYQYGGTIAFSL